MKKNKHLQKISFLSVLILTNGILSRAANPADLSNSNPSVNPISEFPYKNLQWGLKNNGDTQNIDIEYSRVYKVPGRKGMDANWLYVKNKINRKIKVAILDTGAQIDHEFLNPFFRRNELECKKFEEYKACVVGAANEAVKGEACDQKFLLPENDFDKNGYPLDCYGWSITNAHNPKNKNPAGILGSPIIEDSEGHGTHVSGIIASSAVYQDSKNQWQSNVEIIPVAVIGRSPTEPLRPLSTNFTINTPALQPNIPTATPTTNMGPVIPNPVKPGPVIPNSGAGANDNKIPDLTPTETGKEQLNKELSDFVARGIIYAIENKVDVISLSIGWPDSKDTAFFKAAIKKAIDQGIIVVAAAGNDSTKALLRPCSLEGVICVGSSGPDGAISHFSNYGSGVDIVAPGTNILSTYPEFLRSKRFRNEIGFEYLHGTSQATPLVAAAAAQMLAAGIDKSEIYSRLVTTATPLKSRLPIKIGSGNNTINENINLSENNYIEKRFVLSGVLNLKSAIENYNPNEALLLPLHKENKIVYIKPTENEWDIEFELVNHSKDLDFNSVKVELLDRAVYKTLSHLKSNVKSPNSNEKEFKNSTAKSVTAIQLLDKNSTANNLGPIWKKGESRILNIHIARNKFLESEISIPLQISAGDYSREFELRTELITSLESPMNYANFFQVFNLTDLPMKQFSYLPVDSVWDTDSRIDYLSQTITTNSLEYTLYRPITSAANLLDAVNNPIQGTYSKINSFELKFKNEKDFKNYTENLRIRADLNGDGKSEYILIGTIDRNKGDKDSKDPNEMIFTVLDNDFRFISQTSITTEYVQLPTKDQLHLMRLNSNQLTFAWFNISVDYNFKRSYWDYFKNEAFNRPVKRINYIDTQSKYGFSFLNPDDLTNAIPALNEFKIVESLPQNGEFLRKGRFLVLLEDNLGTDVKPSYPRNYKIGIVERNKLIWYSKNSEKFFPIQSDANMDSIDMNSNNGQDLGVAFSFADSNRSQSIWSLFAKNNFFNFYYNNITAYRGAIDGVLKVRSVYFSTDTGTKTDYLSTFVFTNSELQFFKDQINCNQYETVQGQRVLGLCKLENRQVVSGSAERYSFIPDIAFTPFHIPVGEGIYIPDSIGLVKGMKVKSANYQENRLATDVNKRIQAIRGKGCKALDDQIRTPTGKIYVDFQCRNQLVRIPLN